MTGEPAFFELGVEDYEKGKAFYGALFGWDFTPGPDHGYEISTPGLPGGIHGGDKGSAPYLFFLVEDIDAAAAKVQDLGGEIVDMDVSGDEAQQAESGRFKLCRDDQGSPFGLHQRPAG